MAKKIALVHDYIKEYGGAEKVLETLHTMYPDAPVFTLVYCPDFLGPHKERFTNWDIRPSFLQYLPFKHKFISIFRLFAPFIFKTFDFAGFEIIIVSATGAYNPNMIEKKNAKQICYCHTPPRYLYGYATAREWKKNLFLRILGETANHFLRLIDYRSSQNVDQFIANSENIKKRIEKFYRRDAIVVYPPAVKVSRSKYHVVSIKKESYYLAGGRLARAKHYDLIIKACAELGLALKIFGKGFAGYEEELRALHSSLGKEHSEFLGEVPDDKKFELMRGAKAFVFAGEDEDFGIMPVESMSVGTPVIAYKSGGVLETVVDGKTGIFFKELTVSSLVSAIKKFEKLKLRAEDCIKQSERFSEEKFKKEIEKIVIKLS
ncbi:MAG TPA: glycosyltransferase [Candidatus Saccharimonadales bacterium]|nr:glycosyltransferase [Candidatus Saccharimonadales bacterium]